MLVQAIKDTTGKDVTLGGETYDIFYIHDTVGAEKPVLSDRNTQSEWLSLGWSVMDESLKADAQTRYDEIVSDLLQKENQDVADKTAINYLASTDWYITRQTETGVVVPTDILTKRAEARAAVVSVA